jgi:hypothetical protein
MALLARPADVGWLLMSGTLDNAEMLLQLLYGETPAVQAGGPSDNAIPVGIPSRPGVYAPIVLPSAWGWQPFAVTSDVAEANPWDLYVCDASGGDFSITLPDPTMGPAPQYPQVALKNIGASGTVTLEPFGSETIEGASSLAVAFSATPPYPVVWLISDLVNWWRIL